MNTFSKSSRAKLALSTLAAACLLAAASSSVADIREPVKLDSGELGGSIESAAGIREFRGIPFAAPPVGNLRWHEPQPVVKWDGVRSAAQFGNVCIQPDGGARGNIGLLPEGIGMSEDCLYLNVWTGADSAAERRPVMMYIYGGNYSEGAGSAPLYNGTELAKKGAVVVTMNYRMGSFGFFAHPALTAESPNKSSGNYGIMDMLAALQWIQDNIAEFGGDPGNVTVFGQSAGAMAIGTLVASPKAKGLFHRAISQSGTWMGLNPALNPMGTREQIEQRGKTAADGMNVTTVEQLRALPTEQARTLPTSGNFVVDGYLLPEDATAIFMAGRQNDVDVLVGSNKDELSFNIGGGARRGGGPGGGGPGGGGPGGGGPGGAAPGGARAGGPGAAPAGGPGGPGGPAVAGRGGPPPAGGGGPAAAGRGGPGGPGAPGGRGGAGGPGAGGRGGPGAAGGGNTNDGPFWISRYFADAQLKAGKKAWLYYFAQNPPGPDGATLGAVHAAEVPYVFNNLGEKPLFPDGSDPVRAAASPDDQKVADLMSSYWVNFARTGDPNGPGLPTWKPHEVGNSDTAIILDAHPETETLPPKERLQAIDAQFQAARGGN